MKKVLSALFLMFGFASSADANTPDFSITDESGKKHSGVLQSIELNSVDQSYTINAANLKTGATVSFKNTSESNIILRFNADNKTEKQVIFQASNDGKTYSSDYYALSSCEEDKSAKNRPTRSFLIINKNETKFIKFSLRDCKTGEIDQSGQLDLNSKLFETKTRINDNSLDSSVPSPVKVIGLPTVIIGKETTRYLSTKSARTGKDEFVCGTRNDIESLKLYDGNGKKIDSFSYKYRNEKHPGGIDFTIPNKKGTNYQKMHFELNCKNRKKQLYYFDARPKQIVVKNLPKAGEWLYAEQKYKSDDGSAYNDGFNDFKDLKVGQKFLIVKNGEKVSLGEKCDDCEKVVANKLESQKMNVITLTPVDANDNLIEDYNSISQIVIAGKIYGDGTNAISGSSDANIINEKNRNTLTRPCVAGSRAGCEIALAEINGKKSEIYTGIINKQKVLAYNNVGPTVLYGVDTEWTKYSQNQASPLCNKSESHSNEKRVTIDKKNYFLVGCNIPFVTEKGSDELNFYTFKPAVYKLLFEGKNSPANASYGTDKFTYIHTIEPKDYDAKNNKIFEAADFNASILAIGASLESLKNNRTLSHYDNHLRVADKLKFSGNPANPTITIETTNKANNIATDFSSVTASNKNDISDAIMLTLEPNNPYNHKDGYKDNPKPKEITTDKENITIDMLSNNDFYAGKNTKVNKLNFKREDLLARDYVQIGKSSVDMDISNAKNAKLSTRIETDKAAFVFGYEGEDLKFVDAAIIAPNVARDEGTADGAVYLAGYCDPTSNAACKESGLFISDTIAGHINYFGFDFLAYGKYDKDIKESTTNRLFDYEGANFSQFRRGSDFLRSLNADEVKIQLQGDQAGDYCNIFRNCYALETTRFGTTFNRYKARGAQWHGEGDQGNTIVDGTARRKDQRLGF